MRPGRGRVEAAHTRVRPRGEDRAQRGGKRGVPRDAGVAVGDMRTCYVGAIVVLLQIVLARLDDRQMARMGVLPA